VIIVEVSDEPEEPTEPDVPPPNIPAKYSNHYLLTGADGSEWDLCNGPVFITEGASGFGTPKPENRWKESPAIDGAVWAGARVPQRTLTLPLSIEARDSLPWRDIYDAFFAAIDDEATLTVTTPDARSRSIDIRYDDGADIEVEVDPLLRRQALYPLSFIAGDPYWHGQPVARAYKTGDPQPLFPGPPFHIIPSNVLGSATVTNPGDVDAWPQWEVLGPFDGFTVGLGDSRVSYTGPVAAGERVIIDMDPHMLTIRDGKGNDQWDGVTEADFAAVPPGDVHLDLSLSGASLSTRIRLSFVPRYRRAW